MSSCYNTYLNSVVGKDVLQKYIIKLGEAIENYYKGLSPIPPEESLKIYIDNLKKLVPSTNYEYINDETLNESIKQYVKCISPAQNKYLTISLILIFIIFILFFILKKIDFISNCEWHKYGEKIRKREISQIINKNAYITRHGSLPSNLYALSGFKRLLCEISPI